MQGQYTKGIVATMLAALVWSTAGVLVKLLHQDAFTILFYRSLYAGLLFLAVFRKEAMHFDRRAFLISIFYAPLLICFVSSTKLTTAANAIFLQYIAPAIVLILEPKLLGTKMKRYNLVTVVVCLLGLSFFLFEQKSTGHHWLGDGLALMSGFFLAGLILSLRFSNRSEQMSGILLGNLWVVLVTLPAFLKSGPATPNEHLMLAFLGFVQIGLGYLLFTYGQRRIPALEGSLISMLEPILNPIWVLIWYGEKPALWSLIGGAVILTALMARTIYLRRLTRSMSAG
ncbi:MAG: DMT family transporter [Saprospiraceae bacterium]|nr:DMT family transporter [Candidatus Opimibacter iunctus]